MSAEPRLPRTSRRGRVSSALFKAFLLLSMGSASFTLGLLLVQVFVKG